MPSMTINEDPSLLLSLNALAQRADVDVAVRDRAVIALQHDRVQRRFGDVEAGARGAVHFHVLLHEQAVVEHPDEARVFGLFAAGVEAWRVEPDVIRLPFARRARCVAHGRGATHAPLVDPAVVDAAAVRRRHRSLRSPAIEDLHLVETLQVNAGVRALGEHELYVKLRVAEFLVAHQVHGAVLRAVEDAVAGAAHATQARGSEQALPDDAFATDPLVLRGALPVPAGQRLAVQQ